MAEPAEEKPVAEDLPTADEEHRKQTEAFGGEADDLDTEDFSAADRGDSLEPPTEEPEDRGDAVAEATEDDGEAEVSPESDSEAEDESADDGDQESDSGDEEQAVDATEDEEEDKSDKGIPRHRFNEVNERMKAAERRLAELENREKATEQAQDQSYDFDKAEEEYMELLLDGKTREAAEKRGEIRAAEKEAFKAEAKVETISQVDADATQRELQSLSNQAERMYPIFDENHADFSAAATRKVVTFMHGYIAAGESPGDAFVSALADAIDIYDLDAKYGHVEAQAEPDPDPKPKVTPQKAIKKTKEKIAAAKKQAPPTTAGKGSSEAGAAVPDISQLTDEEFDALPEATQARLRGDVID